jgi:hypothetical protein
VPPLVSGRMKNMDAAKRALFSTNHRTTIRFRAEDGAGDLIDYSAHLIDWEFTIDRDQKVVSGSVSLAWDIDGDSLSPLIEASARNTDGLGGYAPAIYSARFFDFAVAITAVGVEAVEDDHVVIVEGRTGVPDFSDESAIRWELRDMADWLARRQIEDEITYPEQPLADRIQAKLDDWLVKPAATPPTVVVEGSPAWVVRESKQPQSRLLEAIASDADQIGWDLRYDWTPADPYALVLREPRRDVVDPDTTWTPEDDYTAVPVARFDEDGIRNRIRGVGRDVNGVLFSRTANNVPSQDEFGYQFMQMGGDPLANVNTAAEMDRMLDGAVADTGLPPFLHSYKLPLCPYVMLGDYYAFSANGVHYDTEQRGSVERIRHWGNLIEGWTQIDLSGKPRSAYLRWLTKSDERVMPELLSYSLAQASDLATLYSMVVSAPTDELRVWARNGASPLVDGKPDNLYLVAVRKPEALAAGITWPVADGDWQIVIQSYAGQDRYTRVEDTLTVSGLGGGSGGGGSGGPGTAPEEAPPTPELVALAGANARLLLIHSNGVDGFKVEWWRNGVLDSTITYAAGTSSITQGFTAGDLIKANARYTNGGGDGPSSPFTLEVTML